MSHVPQTLDPAATSPNQRFLLALLTITAGLIAVVASHQLLWTSVIVLVLAVVFAVAKWPEASTLTVIFILYSNAAAVAVEFHGVPFILGASFFGLLVIPLLYFVVIRGERILIPQTLCLMLLLAIVRLAGALTARHPDIAMRELITLVTEGTVLYFLVINVVRTPETLRRAIWTLVAAGALISLAPIYQQITGKFDNNLGGFGQVSDAAFAMDAAASTDGPVQPRLAGSIGEQNRYAQVMLMLVPLALFRWWGESNFVLRLLAILASSLITLAVVLTFSRGAAIGLVAVVCAMTSFQYIRVRHLVYVMVGLCGLLIAVPQYGTRIAKLNGLWSMMDPEGPSAGSADGSLKSRVTEMGAAVLVYLDHPLIGVGPGMFRFHYREYAEQIGLRVIAKGRGSHSLYLGLAAETGTIGLVLFSSVVIITLRDLLRSYRKWKTTDPQRANMVASFVLVIVAYLTTSMFLHSAYVRFFWLMMALAYAATRLDENHSEHVAKVSQVPS